jgi:UDP-GlcNAc3NAcA epimerase
MPEEINRVLTDHLSDLLFCPNMISLQNLSSEGIHSGTYMVGDVMADTVERFRNQEGEPIQEQYSVLTIHRPANTDSIENMRNIFDAIERYGKCIIFPVHPRTQYLLLEYGMEVPANVSMIKPIGYPAMLSLMANAEKIITDSGGIQKEAYMLGIPCITLRGTTEWVETLHAGWNHLVGTDPGNIVAALNSIPYGKQRPLFPIGASKKIASLLSSWENTCLHHP